MPLALVVAVLTPPANVPLAPVAGAVNVTTAPGTGAPVTSVTVTASGAANAVFAAALYGVPPVALMFAGASGACPTPVSVMVCEFGVALSKRVSVAVRTPVPVGKKSIFTTHELPAATGVPNAQVDPGANVKSPALVPVMVAGTLKVSGAVPEFVTVSGRIAFGFGNPDTSSTLLKSPSSPPNTRQLQVNVVL